MLTPWWRCIKQDVSTISIVITLSWTQMVLVEKGGSAMWEPGPWFFPSSPVHQEHSLLLQEMLSCVIKASSVLMCERCCNFLF